MEGVSLGESPGFEELREAKPFRILHLGASGRRGGAEAQYELLLSGLERDRFDPIAIYPRRGAAAEGMRAAGVPARVVRFPRRNSRGTLRKRIASWRLWSFARARRVALVHGDLLAAGFTIGLGRSLNVPALIHVRHGIHAHRAENVCLDGASAFVAISEHLAGEIVSAGVDPRRVHVVSDATDVSTFRPCADSPRVLERDFPEAGRIKMGVVGRLEPFKKQHRVVEVLEPMLRGRSDLTLFLIGDGGARRSGYARRLDARIARFPAGRVIATGIRTDMPDVYRSLDLLVTASGGSVMLEAMASALPVVSVTARPKEDLRIVRDGEAGFIVADGDHSSLVRAVTMLADDRALRDDLGARGRQRAVSLFSADRLVGGTVAVYDRLLRAGSSGKSSRRSVAA